MAVWAGGLVTLAAFALRRPATPAVAAAVPRFSAIALGCVAVLATSGGCEAWRLVGSWGALFGTSYGVLVLVKVAGMGVLIGLGYLARRFVHGRLLRPVTATALLPSLASATVGSSSVASVGSASATADGDGEAPRHEAGRGSAVPADADADDVPPRLPSMRALRMSVTIEVAVVAVVLAATAILVSTPTGRESYAPPVSASSAFDTGGPGGAGTLRTLVIPARLGPDQVELTLTAPGGQPFRPAEVRASLYFPARDLGPIPVALTGTGPGRYRAATASFGFTGQWQLRVTVRSDAFDETTIIIPVTVH
jgi:copper transport protein